MVQAGSKNLCHVQPASERLNVCFSGVISMRNARCRIPGAAQGLGTLWGIRFCAVSAQNSKRACHLEQDSRYV